MTRILLASKSERRISWLKENLEDSDFRFFSSALKSTEIKPPQGFEVSKQVEIVCQSKAENARIENKLSLNRRDENYHAIIVSDTMIEDPDDHRLSIGKPKDALTATSNLIRLAGRKHRVWSSTSILLPLEVATGKADWDILNRTSCATVEFSELGDDEIYDLISSESWKGKAGGYDLAGTAGQFCRVVEGEEVTVLGFSPAAVDILKQAFSR
jgi:predicted house-cleaning NTP pyrophosphatase (Maf/HAM1 superfamily)